MEIIVLIILFIIGACFGSFLCCQARRLRLKEEKKKSPGKRSVCLSCKTKLKWYDNIPIISWLILRGRCRKCGKKIGLGEILSEVLIGLAFFLVGLGAFLNGMTVGLFLTMPLINYILLVIFIGLFLSLGFLAIYDGLYGELPVIFLIISVVFSIIIVVLKQLIYFSDHSFSWHFLGDLALSVAILGGLYLLLFQASKGKWVGDGDWILGVVIGLVLGKPFLALIVLFLSNFIACMVMFPLTKGKNARIPFGPFLILAFVIVLAFSSFLLNMI